MALGSGPCLTIQDLAKQVEAALDGVNGVSPLVSVGTVTVVSAGMPPTVTDVGDPNANPPTVILNFEFPSGGVDGIDGDDAVAPTVVAQIPTITGAAGTDANVETIGTPENVILAFTIPRGDVGAVGATPDISVNSTTTLAAGSAATVEVNAASDPDADPPTVLLDFGIPRGEDGAGPGGTSYQRPSIVVRLVSEDTGLLLGAYDTTDNTKLPGTIGLTNIPIRNTGEFADIWLIGQIWGASYSISSNAYELLHELTPLNLLIVDVTEAATPSTDTFTADVFGVANGRWPTNSSGADLTSISVDNNGRINVAVGDQITVYYDITTGDDESDRWSTFSGGTGELAVVVIVAPVAAASVSTTSVSAGTGVGILMEQTAAATYSDAGVPLVDLINIAERDVYASNAEPVALACSLQPEGNYLVVNIMDLRAVEGLEGPADKKILTNNGWVPFCYNGEFVIDVGVSDADPAVLYYTKLLNDGSGLGQDPCVEEDVDIIEIGDCSTPAAAATAGTSWDSTGFWQ